LRPSKYYDGIVFFQIFWQGLAEIGTPAIYIIPKFRENGADPAWIRMFLMDDQ
jgi:hypothetical protein